MTTNSFNENRVYANGPIAVFEPSEFTVLGENTIHYATDD